MYRVVSSLRKCPKQQIRGYTELRRSEEELRSEVLALRERLTVVEATSKQANAALDQANNKILELQFSLEFLQQEVKAELVEQENNHRAEIDEYCSTSAAEIGLLNQEVDELKATRDAYQSQLVSLGIDPVSGKRFSEPSEIVKQAAGRIREDSKKMVLRLSQSLENATANMKMNMQNLEKLELVLTPQTH